MKKEIGIISGGSGSSKFSTAFDRYLSKNDYDLGFICNVADNFWFHSFYVCPDIDIITYALSKRLDQSRGWGIKRDSKNFLKGLSKLGAESWFSIGDEDLAISVFRTELFRNGHSLSEITERVRKALRIRHQILPASDDNVQTKFDTSKGRLNLQEFWVKMKAHPRVYKVEYVGIENALPSSKVLKSVSKSVVILPANPITSILPTVRLKGLEKALSRANVIAISPFIGKSIISGPAAKLMRAIGIEPSSYGVARLYSRFIKSYLVDTREDEIQIMRIRELGIECIRTNIMIRKEQDRKSISREIMALV